MDTEDFDYVRPMEKAPATCQIKDEDYGAFLNTLKNTQLYDAIVFEASSGFTQEKLRLFSNPSIIIFMSFCLSNEPASRVEVLYKTSS